MNKNLIIAFVVVMAIGFASPVLASDVSTLLYYKWNYINPDDESVDPFIVQDFCAFFEKPAFDSPIIIGANFEFNYAPRTNNFKFTPTVVLKYEEWPLYLVGGNRVDSIDNEETNEKYHAGFWFAKKFEDLNLFVLTDSRIFWDKKTNDKYFDFFGKAEYSFDRFMVGVNVAYDYFFDLDENQNWYLAGPVAGYRVFMTDAWKASLCARYAMSFTDEGKDADSVRLYTEVKF